MSWTTPTTANEIPGSSRRESEERIDRIPVAEISSAERLVDHGNGSAARAIGRNEVSPIEIPAGARATTPWDRDHSETQTERTPAMANSTPSATSRESQRAGDAQPMPSKAKRAPRASTSPESYRRCSVRYWRALSVL